MGVGAALGALFGSGRNVVTEVAGAFIPNAENQAERQSSFSQASLAQYAAEFRRIENRNWFDSLIDGLNRSIRPVITYACVGILVATPINPVLMTEVYVAWALIPASLWAIIGGVFGFFFTGRIQIKGHEIRKELAATAQQAPIIIDTMRQIREIRHDTPLVAEGGDVEENTGNAALNDWKSQN